MAADNPVDQGTWSTTPWTLDSNGNLVLGKPGATTDLETMRGMPDSLRPGAAHNKDVKNISIAKGATVELWGSSVSNASGHKANPVLTCSFTDNPTDNTAGAFAGFPNLTKVDLTGARQYPGWHSLFGWPISYHNLFCGDTSLTDVIIPKGVVTKGAMQISTAYTNDLSGMFFGDSSLRKLDLSNFDTGRTARFTGMFGNDSKLETIKGIENLPVARAVELDSMFRGDSAITSLDLSKWKPTVLSSMAGMFRDMSALKSLDLQNLATPDMALFGKGPMDKVFVGTTALRQLTLGKDFGFTFSIGNSEPVLDGGSPGQNGAFDAAPVIGPDGTIHPGPQVANNTDTRYYTGLWQEIGTGTPDKPNGEIRTTEQLASSDRGKAIGTWVWQAQPVKYDSVKIPQTGTAALTNELGFQGDGQHGVSWDGNETTVSAGQKVTVLPAVTSGPVGPQAAGPDGTKVLAVRKTTVNPNHSFSWADKDDQAVQVSLADPKKPMGQDNRVKLSVKAQQAAPGLYTVFTNYKTNLPGRKSPSKVFTPSKGFANLRVDSYVYVQAPPTANATTEIAVNHGQTVTIGNHAAADSKVPAAGKGEWTPAGANSLDKFKPASLAAVSWGSLPAGIHAAQADPKNPAAGVKFMIDQTVPNGVYKVAVTYTDDLGQQTVSNDVITVGQPVDVFRLYNKNTGEHFYTQSAGERDSLVRSGWRFEGTLATAPASGEPVYRLYNPNVPGGDHYYTLNHAEADGLVKLGWKWDNGGKPVFYSGGDVNVYVEYNPAAKAGAHNYTTNKAERDALVKAGWKDQGVAWKAVGSGK